MNKIRDALNRTDWHLLAEQKLALLHAIDNQSGYLSEQLTGLLNFVDAIQDAAEADGFPVEFIVGEKT